MNQSNGKKSRVLWISAYAPYDKVRHAGGKIHNYYLKKLHDQYHDIFLLTVCRENELDKIDLKKYNIDFDLIVLKKNIKSKALRYLSILNAKYNSFHKYGGMLKGFYERPLKKSILKLSEQGINPEVIILEWTETVLLIPFVKKIFPESRIIAIEEDVSYLGIYRKWEYEKNKVLKTILSKQYEKLKEIEIEALNYADKVILNNPKDQRLIASNGVSEKKTFVWSPYFESMDHIEKKQYKNKIIFYGAMERKENYLSAIWFIENVMPLIAHLDIAFEIIGNNPPEMLKKYENNRIHVLGFVDSVEEHFADSLCLVAPLVLGAGVKIKILEALSSGLPVLTNAIGIEGILAEDKKDFFYCESPSDYAQIIKKMLKGEIDREKISHNAQKFMREHYNLEESAARFIYLVKELSSKGEQNVKK